MTMVRERLQNCPSSCAGGSSLGTLMNFFFCLRNSSILYDGSKNVLLISHNPFYEDGDITDVFKRTLNM